MKTKLTVRQFAFLSSVGLALLGLSSCLPLVAGAAVGYVAHKDGYRVSNPIHRR